MFKAKYMANSELQTYIPIQTCNDIGEDYLKRVLKMNYGRTQRDDFSNSEKCQLAFNNYFYKLYKEDKRVLYKLELTYKLSERVLSNSQISKEVAKKYFIQFHTRFVLPNLYGRHYQNKKKEQPICYAFLECHGTNEYHHHTIYAVKESDTSFFDRFVGENTLIDVTETMYSKSYSYLTNLKTSYLQRIDVENLTQPIYATKQLKNFHNDFLVFPDAQVKRKNKHQLTKPNFPQHQRNFQKTMIERFSNLHK